MPGLGPAHAGYMYQDLVTAYFMARAIVEGFLNQVAQRIVPDIETHVARWNSRVLRPSIALPSEQKNEQDVPSRVSLNGEYPEWYRVGYFEEEALLTGDSVTSDYKSTMTVTYGIEIAIPGVNIDLKGYLPFGVGNLSSWHTKPVSSYLGTRGPLVGLTFSQDFLGLYPILTLPHAVTSRLQLMRSPDSGRLQFNDKHGSPGVVFRQWHLRPLGESLGEAAPSLSGCDLLVCPDVWDRIKYLFPHREFRPHFHKSEHVDS